MTTSCSDSESPSPSQNIRLSRAELVKVDGRVGCDLGTWIGELTCGGTVLTHGNGYVES